MYSESADFDLLLIVMALKLDMINQDQLEEAIQEKQAGSSSTVSDFLVQHRHLKDSDRTLLESLAMRHVEKNGGDIETSLAQLKGTHDVNQILSKYAYSSHIDTMTHVIDEQLSDSSDGVTTTRSLDPNFGHRYQILRPHAEGGLGTVSIALDQQLRREVAFKEIKDRFADNESARIRFRFEAEVTGKLEHPGIVPIYGMGEQVDGRPFYSMRFIDGATLQDECLAFHKKTRENRQTKTTLEFRQLLGRFVDICNAVHFAHSKGFLHRDLKPSNVMLGKYGETLVVDWGLAKSLGQSHDQVENTNVNFDSNGDSTPNTVVGSAIGTPHYMSPEQASGNVDQIGPASDVYSLGATLFFILTGDAPYSGMSSADVLRLVTEGDVPSPPSTESFVPKPLLAICEKAMSRLPSDRYATAHELASEIEHWLADEPLEAFPETMLTRGWRWYVSTSLR